VVVIAIIEAIMGIMLDTAGVMDIVVTMMDIEVDTAVIIVAETIAVTANWPTLLKRNWF
jgi:hypothetical protein